MSPSRFGIQLVCAIAACVAVSAPAAAQRQQPTGGPFSGLFKGSPQDQPQTLDLRASAFAAWDDNLLAQTPGGGGAGNVTSIDPRFLKQGIANGFQGSLSYGFRRAGVRSQFTVTGDASAQQFASEARNEPFWFHTYNAGIGLKTKVTNKSSLSFGAGTSYMPYFQYAPFLKSTTSEESPVGNDYGFAVDSVMVRSASASVSFENRLSKKSSISAGIGWDQNVIPGYEQSGIPADGGQANANVDRRTAQATFNHNLTRKLGFHVGYGIQESRYVSGAEARPGRTHNLEVGLGYGDGITLTFGRQTLTLSMGASIAKNGDPVSVASGSKNTAFVVDGHATLTRPIGRTWGTSIEYMRGTHYMVGFPQPYLTDSANAGIGGRLATRLQFSAGVGASRGQELFAVSGGGNIISYTASTRLTYALFSHLGLYSQASYYRFSIPPGSFANFGFVPKLDRRSVSVGLSTWVPLIKPQRQRRDSGNPPTTGQP